MNFLQGDILDKEMVNKLFKDADVVHHLAESLMCLEHKVSQLNLMMRKY